MIKKILLILIWLLLSLTIISNNIYAVDTLQKELTEEQKIAKIAADELAVETDRMKLNLASERDDLSDSLEHAENALDTKKESVDYDNKINLYNGLIESDPTNASIHQLSIDNLNKEIENEQSTYTKANNSIETFDDEYPWTVSIDTATDEYNQTMIDRWTQKQKRIWAKNAVEKLQNRLD